MEISAGMTPRSYGQAFENRRLRNGSGRAHGWTNMADGSIGGR